jgi:fluoride exporter
MMQDALAVFLGGGLGAVLRFYVGAYLPSLIQHGSLEWRAAVTTLCVNVLGSSLAALLYFRFALDADHPWRAFVLIGLMGGFTTFSAFSMDAYKLINAAQIGLAAIYVASSVVLSLLGVFVVACVVPNK